MYALYIHMYVQRVYGYKIDRQYDSLWLISMYTRVRGTT